METKKNTKILALILCILMLLSCLPLTALADGPASKLHCVENAGILRPAGEGRILSEEPVYDENGYAVAYRYNLIDHMSDSVLASMVSDDDSIHFMGWASGNTNPDLNGFVAVNRDCVQFYSEDLELRFSYPVENIAFAVCDTDNGSSLSTCCVYYITNEWDALYGIDMAGTVSTLFTFGNTYRYVALDEINGLLAVTTDPIGNERTGELLVYDLRAGRFVFRMDDSFEFYYFSKDYLICESLGSNYRAGYSLDDYSMVISYCCDESIIDYSLVQGSNYLLGEVYVTDNGEPYWTLQLIDLGTDMAASLEDGWGENAIHSAESFMYSCVYADGSVPYLYITLASDSDPDAGIYIRDCTTLQYTSFFWDETWEEEEYTGKFRIIYRLIQRLIENLKAILDFMRINVR